MRCVGTSMRELLKNFIEYVLKNRDKYVANIRQTSVLKITTRDLIKYIGELGCEVTDRRVGEGVNIYTVSWVMGLIEDVLNEYVNKGLIAGYECFGRNPKRCLIYLERRNKPIVPAGLVEEFLRWVVSDGRSYRANKYAKDSPLKVTHNAFLGFLTMRGYDVRNESVMMSAIRVFHLHVEAYLEKLMGEGLVSGYKILRRGRRHRSKPAIVYIWTKANVPAVPNTGEAVGHAEPQAHE